MPTPSPATPVPSLHPAVIGAALDCLAAVPEFELHDPAHFQALAAALGLPRGDALTLIRRLAAAARVMEDPRWRPWTRYARTLPPPARARFDAMVLALIAGMPLPALAMFDADCFFDALLGRAAPELN